MIENNKIPQLIADFKEELKRTSNINIVRKHLLTGECFVFSSGDYFDLRSEVAHYFKIHPTEVLVVGSAKLGFSISPKKLFLPFRDESDIDVAIVSSQLFDRVWQAAFDYKITGGYWENLSSFSEYLFRGWIRPDFMPPEHKFEFCREWWKYFNTLTSSGRYGPFKIRCGLYKSWYFLENYHSHAIKECKNNLEGIK